MKFPVRLGDQGQYELGEVAFNHIIRGDTRIRPVSTPAGRVQETVLSGGLHTYAGWKAFLGHHPKVAHLLDYRVGVDDAWYFARELQNGVVTLKIPRRLFTGSAASITRQPDEYFKSGYLWKTLFPIGYSEDDVLNSIREALLNLDREDSEAPSTGSRMRVLYGYASTGDPLTAIKIRIQVEGDQIRSAFPSWDQPHTGNNGKPYSPEHSIGFQIAESTLEHEKFRSLYGPVFKKDELDLNALLDRTPGFIKFRPSRKADENVEEFRLERKKLLRQLAHRVSFGDLQRIEEYLSDYPCAKDPFIAQHSVYQHRPDLVDEVREIFNSVQFSENVGECLYLLAAADELHKTRRAVAAITRFLGMAVIHVGGLNTLMFKALIGKMLSIAMRHHDRSAIKDTFKALAESPSRFALYTEFDLNPFVKENSELGLAVIALPSIKLSLTVDHLVEFVAFNLGENYLLNFTYEQRLGLASKIVETQCGRRLAADVMAQFAGEDFDFFISGKFDPTDVTQDLPDESDLIAIVRDYGRMLLVLRQRIVLEDSEAYRTEPDYSQVGTLAHFELMRQKHKYEVVRFRHWDMLRDVKNFADKVGYEKLSLACQAATERFGEDSIPLPKPIPDYIDSWRQKYESGAPMGTELATHVLGQ
ncbi:EndoU domain-containing protein [Xanthomonas euvesicatoria]|uniref:EndoU domain-containing protein n=1 Tax=Xanthomonas euvesicatoria TaxID=456327 RepID=UPI001C43C19C|nr:EndoU domain-containing protein [Xanthomonas euvesicatoria]MBV6799649.1 EndoU domain-containing protein [Xanthomonas campestris pv. obscurae]